MRVTENHQGTNSRLDAFFFYLIDSWNSILKSRFADYTKLSLIEKTHLTETTGRNILLLVFLLPLWLPLITLLHRWSSSTCLEYQNSPGLCPCPSSPVFYFFTDYLIHSHNFNFSLLAGPIGSGSRQGPSLSSRFVYAPGCVVATLAFTCPAVDVFPFYKNLFKLKNCVSFFPPLLHPFPTWGGNIATSSGLVLWSWTELGPNLSCCFQICRIHYTNTQPKRLL